MTARIIVALAAAASLAFVTPSRAAVDSLLGDLGNTFTFLHMYSKPGGETVVEEAVATVSQPNTAASLLFSGPTTNTRVYWVHPGFVSPIKQHAPAPFFTIVLQGEFVVTASGGKEYRLKPGAVLLAEDYDGEGHGGRCESAAGTAGCVQVVVMPQDRDKFFANVTMTKVEEKKCKNIHPEGAPPDPKQLKGAAFFC